MALNHPRSGQVLIDGRDIVNFEPADLADQIGYVFQNPDLQILGDTVYEEVAYGLANKKLPRSTIDRQVRDAVEAMGLTPFWTVIRGPFPLVRNAALALRRPLRFSLRP